MEIKSARDLRVALAWHDISGGQVARAAGIRPQKLSELLHGKARVTPVMRERVERTLGRVAAGEIVLEPCKPRGKTRLERLREKQLASGCQVAVRSL